MKIRIGKGSCGIAAGANKIKAYLAERLAAESISAEITTTGCIGMCYLEPIVDLVSDDGRKKTFVRVTNEAVDSMVEAFKHSASDAGGVDDPLKPYLLEPEDQDFLSRQTRIALQNCGLINPEHIEEYIAANGYASLRKCLHDRTQEAVIDEIKRSGLRGRGGAGFPTWFKWKAAHDAPGDKKYIICNADEGDPGAFMDRAIMEGDPHAIIEGMLIAAYAVGADEGIIYVRAEYPLAVARMENAIMQAEKRGFLGENILKTDFCFNLRIKAGAGAFVCGEETALIESLEGERGMPRLKPPFPAQKGYRQKPTNINNVETYANIAWILRNGGEAFSALGTPDSKGTKVFALTGKIKKGGLVEVPMGLSLREIIDGIAGGVKDGKAFKAVQMGGPSGGCIPASRIDTLIDYKTLAETGAIMGSGGMVVMDESTCMVDMARFFLDFTCRESCGKCTHCRVGTKRMLEILTRITEGKGREGDIELLEDLALQIKEGALCGLGNSAPNPVLTTIRYFRNEYEDHIFHQKCTAGQCTALLTYSIDEEKCTGCTLCAKKCPAHCITGELKKPHRIGDGCVRCGQCRTVCRAGAVLVR